MKFFQFFKNLFQRNIAQRAFAFSFDKAFRDSFLFLALACFDIFFFPFIPIEMRFLFRSFLWFMVLFLVFYYYILGKRKQFVAPRKSLHRGQIPLYKKLKKSNKKIRKLLFVKYAKHSRFDQNQVRKVVLGIARLVYFQVAKLCFRQRNGKFASGMQTHLLEVLSI